MVAMSTHYAFVERSWSTTRDDLWKSSIAQVDSMKSYADGHNTKDSELASKLTYLNSLGEEVSGNAERRLKWLEIIKSDQCGGTSNQLSRWKGTHPQGASLLTEKRYSRHLSGH